MAMRDASRTAAELPPRVTIVEVGPRDGLQNESTPIPTSTKRDFVRALAESGLRDIEVTSFVHPRYVPQLADAADVLADLDLDDTTIRYSALVPNARGMARAIESGVKSIAVFTAASDAFTHANIRMSVDESLAAFRPILADALANDIQVRGYVSTSFVCPYTGVVPTDAVVRVAHELDQMGCHQIAISDTIGAAVPTDVDRVIDAVVKKVDVDRIALHLHDTYGTALANVYAGLQHGITTIDASAGGLGGCPYAPGAAGNLATEDLVYFLDQLGIESGVDLEKVFAASSLVAGALGRDSLPGKNWQRLAASCAAAPASTEVR